MFIPAGRMFDVIGKEFQKVCELLPDGPSEASSAQSIGCVLGLLRQRHRQGVAALRVQFAGLQDTADQLGNDVGLDLSELRGFLAQAAGMNNLEDLEALWVKTLAVFEGLIIDTNGRTDVSNDAKLRICEQIINFEAADLNSQMAEDAAVDEGSNSRAITREKLEAYLKDRFREEGIKVTSMKPLAGGFGKETILFSVEGQALAGEFVMRRDIGENSGIDNDCHKIQKEYPVIRAAFEKGFPAPDALWLDTEHALLPGSDFIVMRRSEGESGGSFFGTSAKISDNLTGVLADITARLHNLPPLEELGNLTESICTASWNMTKSESIEFYIRGWYEFWKRETHNPSPAIASLYGWLLNNVPERSGPPSLLHGDIGFHNFLLQDGEINAVLDWEFAHIGDPAEDLGYIKTTVGNALDWDQFMQAYLAAGGSPVDAKTLNYFQVWAYVRNASAANLVSSVFVNGGADDLKLGILPYIHLPLFIRGALAAIQEREKL
jgi:aminoglycoside phosphotransferase (APT) family kinase protein